MANGLNKVQIIGNLGGDPELKYMPSGKAVTNFSVAVNEVYYADTEKKETVEWFYISAFGRAAEIASEYLEKGSQVYIEGRLQTREWEDKETGEPRKATGVILRHLIILKGKARERDPEDPTGGQEQIHGLGEKPDDDIPF